MINASTTQSNSSLPSFTTATKKSDPKMFWGIYILHWKNQTSYCWLHVLPPLASHSRYFGSIIHIYVCVWLCNYIYIRTSLQVSSTNLLICYWYIYHRCIPVLYPSPSMKSIWIVRFPYEPNHSPSSAPVRSCAMHRHRTGRRTWGTSQLGAWKMLGAAWKMGMFSNVSRILGCNDQMI